MREISIEGARKVCQAVTYESYMVDDETMVTVFTSPKALDEIEQQKANAREALTLGVPALFSFDVVKVGDRYGVIYEDLHAKSLGQQIMDDKGNFDHYVELYTDFVKGLHATHVTPGVIPSVKDNFYRDINAMGELITEGEKDKARAIVAAAPDGDSFLSQMLAPTNIRYQDDELFLNDFSRIAYGSPFFDLSAVTISLAQSAEADIPESMRYLVYNMDRESAVRLCEGLLRRYYDVRSDEQYQRIYRLMRLFGLVKVMLAPVTAPSLDERYKKAVIVAAREQLFPNADKLIAMLGSMRL
jgi:uncharacterized protein (TIGR02172 family)